MLGQLKYRLRSFRLSRGFTLIELMVTLTLIGVLAGLAVPSYRTFLINQQLSSASTDFLVSMLQARAEALRLGKNVAVLPTTGTSWSNGWYLSVVDNNCALTGSTFGQSAVPGSFISINTGSSTNSFASASPSFTYAPSGFPYTSCASPYFSGSMNGTLAFFVSATGRERRVIVSNSGRARICDPDRETCTAIGG
jgi:type IV fimbrial biogenesis protein FimT